MDDCNKNVPEWKIPTRAPLSGLIPGVIQRFNDVNSFKTSQTETNTKRHYVPERICSQSYLAFMVCAKNMSHRRAMKMCNEEIEDWMECRFSAGSEERRKKLEKASRRVGDVVPSVNGKGKYHFY